MRHSADGINIKAGNFVVTGTIELLPSMHYAISLDARSDHGISRDIHCAVLCAIRRK